MSIRKIYHINYLIIYVFRMGYINLFVILFLFWTAIKIKKYQKV